jgi:2'-5' RNA ligase
MVLLELATTMKSIRAFIAITLPQLAVAALGSIGQQLAQSAPPGAVRWLRPETMHLTLRFLGESPVDRLDELAGRLDEVAAGHAPFELRLGRLGCFPNLKRPRVLWVGLEGESGKAEALAHGVEATVQALGWEPESKPFRPHLTIGRVKDGRGLERLAWDTKVEPAAVPVMAIHLIESQLRPSGPLYTIRHTSPLALG